MKTLYLIRHAHAEPEAPLQADRDRPLSPRGQQDARAMGERLRSAGTMPESLVCSPALRTRQTAQALASAMGLPASAVVVEERLYASTPDMLLELAGHTDPARRSVAIVGHNPECSELLGRFEPGTQGMSPGTVVILDFDATTWGALASQAPRQVRRMQPGD